jgi:hypothetical protein
MTEEIDWSDTTWTKECGQPLETGKDKRQVFPYSLQKEKIQVSQCLVYRPIQPNLGQALVAHAYNPSYSGGRKQEDHGSKPAPGK